jgi:membrane protein YqaA with SNARE-associated domain
VLASYIRATLLKLVVSLALLFGTLVVIGLLFEAELLAVAEATYQALGAPGLLGLVFVGNAVFSPLPSDVVLVVIANSTLRSEWLWLVPGVGLVSAVGGNVAWLLGRQLAQFPWAAPWLRQIRARHEGLLHRYDSWALILAAVTPSPFSLICISAGALGMPWARLAPIMLLRVPRFLLSYLVIVGSVAL